MEKGTNMIGRYFLPRGLSQGPSVSARYAERLGAVAGETGLARECEKFLDNLRGRQPKECEPRVSDSSLDGVFDEVERRRLKAIEDAFYFPRWIPYRAPLEKLTGVEQTAVVIFADKVKPILNRIEARQHHPDADRLAQWMNSGSGDYFSSLLFRRFGRDTAPGPFGHDQSLFPFFPDLPILNGMIHAGITVEEFEALEKGSGERAEDLRPTTMLSKDREGRIVSTPLPLHPDFSRDHQELADTLDRIAALKKGGRSLDPALADQLKQWALFFRRGSAVDEAAAVQATIDAGEGGGNLRIHIGPSESYWPDNTKFPYLLQVGIRDRRLADQLRCRQDTFCELEASLADILHYQPRRLSARGGFADPIYQAVTGGFIESFSGGEPGGNNFPNYSGYGVEGTSRFVLLEHVEIEAGRNKAVLERLLDEDISRWDPVRSTVEFIVDHESGHMLGPLRDHKTPDGRRMGAVFGKHWGGADEPKADQSAVQTVRVLRGQGRISTTRSYEVLRSLIGLNLSWRYKGKSAFAEGLTDHFYGHMIEVGFYFREGILTLVSGKDGNAGIHVDYEKCLQQSGVLWKKIISFQAAGDLKGFLEFGTELVAAIPDEADQWILAANQGQRPFFIQRHR